MSLPQLLARVLIQGSQILGKAFLEAGRQAGRNLRASPEAAASAQSAGPAGSKIDELTRAHKMTVEEARMILNFKPAAEGEAIEVARERMAKTYDHLFAVNAPPAPKGQKGGGSGSFYMQSKVVRAKQRIEAEWEQLAKNVGEAGQGGGAAAESTSAPPPPPPPAA